MSTNSKTPSPTEDKPTGEPRRNPSELPQACRWVSYEIWMLYETAKLLAMAKERTPLANALLESVLLHTRALFEFFDPRQVRPNSVLAQDFFPVTWTRPHWKGKGGLRDRIHWHLAHITDERSREGDSKVGWNITEIVDLFDDPIERFREMVNRALPDDPWTPPIRPSFSPDDWMTLYGTSTCAASSEPPGCSPQKVRTCVIDPKRGGSGGSGDDGER